MADPASGTSPQTFRAEIGERRYRGEVWRDGRRWCAACEGVERAGATAAAAARSAALARHSERFALLDVGRVHL